MTRIHLLDDATINKIAAGEVVERPASVVKELVENAVDAGATKVRVEITTDHEHVSSVRVVDDGEGMTAEDAALAFARHATSKIRSSDDLASIHSMGFRGEALASIASVSRVLLVTKPRGGDGIGGTRVLVEAGEILDSDETGAPAGTDIRISDLFFNTPARRKFLKTVKTELQHILQIAEAMALAHPDTSFSLLVNGNGRLRTPGTGLFNAVMAIFGVDTATSLIPVSRKGPKITIDGYCSPIRIDRPNAEGIMISVNGRQVASPALTRAVREGYRTLLPRGRYPLAVLNISVDSAQVDINVHPTKREVRIDGEAGITREVSSAIAEALEGSDLAGRRASEVKTSSLGERGEGPAVREAPPLYRTGHQQHLDSDSRLRRTREGNARGLRRLPPLRVLGQVEDAYIIARTGGGEEEEELAIIDQHAAHERVLYEQLLRRRGEGVESQELITPLIISLRPGVAASVRSALHILQQEGFLLEEFGPDTFAVRTIPVVLGRQPEPGLIQDILQDISEGVNVSLSEGKEKITTIIACRGAIKAGAPLTADQMTTLIDQLAHCERPFTCPHGRPAIVMLSRSELDALFRRT
ncbi:MAG: DNA mismatch repair endonuclease MutL [Methanomicrobiaceae archaeon]|nr:DNA mismatch repair endonuclease MutL [Methanomicrobiaceae archaeon]